MKKIMLVFGTRPEAIKMAPLVKEFNRYPELFDTVVTVTGQHREMLYQVLDLFGITPDYNLDIMQPRQGLTDVTIKVMEGLNQVLSDNRPDVLLVHGDTTTSMSAALVAFYHKIPVGHVEAGLRTNTLFNPWPEEANRQITARLATWHFAPTELNRANLLAENILNKNIVVTGNTVVDALNSVMERLKHDCDTSSRVRNSILHSGYDIGRLKGKRRLVLVTAHRRENLGVGLESVGLAIKSLALKYPEVDFVCPLHLNPEVRAQIIGNDARSHSQNLFFIEPLDYLAFVSLMEKAYLILTDSGGVQEEAPCLGTPVLVMRQATERPEAIESGGIKLVGTDRVTLEENVSLLLDDAAAYSAMCAMSNFYGDGLASKRIVSHFINMK